MEGDTDKGSKRRKVPPSVESVDGDKDGISEEMIKLLKLHGINHPDDLKKILCKSPKKRKKSTDTTISTVSVVDTGRNPNDTEPKCAEKESSSPVVLPKTPTRKRRKSISNKAGKANPDVLDESEGRSPNQFCSGDDVTDCTALKEPFKREQSVSQFSPNRGPPPKKRSSIDSLEGSVDQSSPKKHVLESDQSVAVSPGDNLTVKPCCVSLVRLADADIKTWTAGQTNASCDKLGLSRNDHVHSLSKHRPMPHSAKLKLGQVVHSSTPLNIAESKNFGDSTKTDDGLFTIPKVPQPKRGRPFKEPAKNVTKSHTKHVTIHQSSSSVKSLERSSSTSKPSPKSCKFLSSCSPIKSSPKSHQPASSFPTKASQKHDQLSFKPSGQAVASVPKSLPDGVSVEFSVDGSTSSNQADKPASHTAFTESSSKQKSASGATPPLGTVAQTTKASEFSVHGSASMSRPDKPVSHPVSTELSSKPSIASASEVSSHPETVTEGSETSPTTSREYRPLSYPTSRIVNSFWGLNKAPQPAPLSSGNLCDEELDYEPADDDDDKDLLSIYVDNDSMLMGFISERIPDEREIIHRNTVYSQADHDSRHFSDDETNPCWSPDSVCESPENSPHNMEEYEHLQNHDVLEDDSHGDSMSSDSEDEDNRKKSRAFIRGRMEVEKPTCESVDIPQTINTISLNESAEGIPVEVYSRDIISPCPPCECQCSNVIEEEVAERGESLYETRNESGDEGEKVERLLNEPVLELATNTHDEVPKPVHAQACSVQDRKFKRQGQMHELPCQEQEQSHESSHDKPKQQGQLHDLPHPEQQGPHPEPEQQGQLDDVPHPEPVQQGQLDDLPHQGLEQQEQLDDLPHQGLEQQEQLDDLPHQGLEQQEQLDDLPHQGLEQQGQLHDLSHQEQQVQVQCDEELFPQKDGNNWKSSEECTVNNEFTITEQEIHQDKADLLGEKCVEKDDNVGNSKGNINVSSKIIANEKKFNSDKKKYDRSGRSKKEACQIKDVCINPKNHEEAKYSRERRGQACSSHEARSDHDLSERTQQATFQVNYQGEKNWKNVNNKAKCDADVPPHTQDQRKMKDVRRSRDREKERRGRGFKPLPEFEGVHFDPPKKVGPNAFFPPLPNSPSGWSSSPSPRRNGLQPVIGTPPPLLGIHPMSVGAAISVPPPLLWTNQNQPGSNSQHQAIKARPDSTAVCSGTAYETSPSSDLLGQYFCGAYLHCGICKRLACLLCHELPVYEHCFPHEVQKLIQNSLKYPWWCGERLAPMIAYLGNLGAEKEVQNVANILWQHDCHQKLKNKILSNINMWKEVLNAFCLCGLPPNTAFKKLVYAVIPDPAAGILCPEVLDKVLETVFGDFSCDTIEVWEAVKRISCVKNYELPIPVTRNVLQMCLRRNNPVLNQDVYNNLIKDINVHNNEELISLIFRFHIMLRQDSRTWPSASRPRSVIQGMESVVPSVPVVKMVGLQCFEPVANQTEISRDTELPTSNSMVPNLEASVSEMRKPVQCPRIGTKDVKESQKVKIQEGPCGNEKGEEIVIGPLTKQKKMRTIEPMAFFKITVTDSSRKIETTELAGEPPNKVSKTAAPKKSNLKETKSSIFKGAPQLGLPPAARQRLVNRPIADLIKDRKFGAAASQIKLWGENNAPGGTLCLFQALVACGLDESATNFVKLLQACGASDTKLLSRIFVTVGFNIFLNLIDNDMWNQAHEVYRLMLHKQLDPLRSEIYPPNKCSQSKKLMLWVQCLIKVGSVEEALKSFLRYNLANERDAWYLPNEDADTKFRNQICTCLIKKTEKTLFELIERLFIQMMDARHSYGKGFDFPSLLDSLLRAMISCQSWRMACNLLVKAHENYGVDPKSEITTRLVLIEVLKNPEQLQQLYTPTLLDLMLNPPYYPNLPTEMTGKEQNIELILLSNWFKSEIKAVINVFFLFMIRKKFNLEALPAIFIRIKLADVPQPHPGEDDVPPMLQKIDNSLSGMVERVEASLASQGLLWEMYQDDVIFLQRDSVYRYLYKLGPYKIPPEVEGQPWDDLRYKPRGAVEYRQKPSFDSISSYNQFPPQLPPVPPPLSRGLLKTPPSRNLQSSFMMHHQPSSSVPQQHTNVPSQTPSVPQYMTQQPVFNFPPPSHGFSQQQHRYQQQPYGAQQGPFSGESRGRGQLNPLFSRRPRQNCGQWEDQQRRSSFAPQPSSYNENRPRPQHRSYRGRFT